MENNRKEPQAVPFDVDTPDAIRPIRHDATLRRNTEAAAAIQYLTWALEEIKKTGSQKAARQTRAAMVELRKLTDS